MRVQTVRWLDHVEVGFGHALAQAFGKAAETGSSCPSDRRRRSDHAEIHQRQVPVVGQQDVARVRIAMKHAVDGDLLHVGREQVRGDRLGVAPSAPPAPTSARWRPLKKLSVRTRCEVSSEQTAGVHSPPTPVIWRPTRRGSRRPTDEAATGRADSRRSRLLHRPSPRQPSSLG